MANIKSADRITKKWAERASVSGGAYEEGINNPRADWATQAKAAESNYEKGVQAGISQKRFGKGIARAGTSKWQQGARDKGIARWSQGISVSQDAYQKGFDPYRQVIAALTLPPRGPKGDPGNIMRVSAVAKALHDKKISMAGA
ncbi:hypothetical protein [Acidithiobacillus sp.]|jgi:hypothetical protein|uniref:hypothetical protein n=1 Tax=Acidithiobacillus sp. TaxID=1872118 RepID=UPI003568ABEE